MRSWRNWQTRTFEGRVGNHPGSSPGDRTKPRGDIASEMFVTTRFFYFRLNGSLSIVGARPTKTQDQSTVESITLA